MKRIILIIVSICSLSSVIAQNITKAEYFIDTDKGFGNNIGIELAEISSDMELTFTADLSGLEPGMHIIYCRVADDYKQWSIATANAIEIIPVIESEKIVSAEYYIDIDPGFDNGTSIEIASSSSDINLTVPIELSSVDEGLHTLYVRVKDENSIWSLVSYQPFYIIDESEIVKIEQLEYYFSSGNETSSIYTFDNFVPATIIELSESDFFANVSMLNYGHEYTLHLRALDTKGDYSSYSTISFTFQELNATGIEGKSQKTLLSFYPNPAKDIIYLNNNIKFENRPASYIIYDYTGKMLVKDKLQGNEISVSALKAGSYHLIIYLEKAVYSGHFVKE